MDKKTRRRLLLAGGTKYIFLNGKINGEIARQNQATVTSERIVILNSGYLSIKVDFTRYKRLYIEIAMLEDVGYGTRYGIGETDSTFISSFVATAGARETKVFDISGIDGEKYINFISSGVMGDTNTYIFNIWMEENE